MDILKEKKKEWKTEIEHLISYLRWPLSYWKSRNLVIHSKLPKLQLL